MGGVGLSPPGTSSRLPTRCAQRKTSTVSLQAPALTQDGLSRAAQPGVICASAAICPGCPVSHKLGSRSVMSCRSTPSRSRPEGAGGRGRVASTAIRRPRKAVEPIKPALTFVHTFYDPASRRHSRSRWRSCSHQGPLDSGVVAIAAAG